MLNIECTIEYRLVTGLFSRIEFRIGENMESQNKATQNNYGAGEASNDEIQLGQLLDSFMMAIQNKDLNKIMSFYAPDVVAFDMMAPLKHVGAEAWRKVWQAALPTMQGSITSEMRDLSVDIGQNVAICHALLNMKLVSNRENHDTWMRWTAGLHKVNGRWLITHEHTSVPTDLQTGKAVMDLRPDGTLTH